MSFFRNWTFCWLEQILWDSSDERFYGDYENQFCDDKHWMDSDFFSFLLRTWPLIFCCKFQPEVAVSFRLQQSLLFPSLLLKRISRLRCFKIHLECENVNFSMPTFSLPKSLQNYNRRPLKHLWLCFRLLINKIEIISIGKTHKWQR